MHTLMKKHFFFLFAAVLSTTLALAQPKGTSYKTAAGVKFYPGAITVKHFIKNKEALEGLAYFWSHGFRITGLYEFHGPINGAPGLKWYAGPGAHIGAWNARWRDEYRDYYNRQYSRTYVGIDGVLGLDYKINGAPINLSLDWQPSFNLGNGPGEYYGFYSGFGGLGIRYTFK